VPGIKKHSPSAQASRAGKEPVGLAHPKRRGKDFLSYRGPRNLSRKREALPAAKGKGEPPTIDPGQRERSDYNLARRRVRQASHAGEKKSAHRQVNSVASSCRKRAGCCAREKRGECSKISAHTENSLGGGPSPPLRIRSDRKAQRGTRSRSSKNFSIEKFAPSILGRLLQRQKGKKEEKRVSHTKIRKKPAPTLFRRRSPGAG